MRCGRDRTADDMGASPGQWDRCGLVVAAGRCFHCRAIAQSCAWRCMPRNAAAQVEIRVGAHRGIERRGEIAAVRQRAQPREIAVGEPLATATEPASRRTSRRSAAAPNTTDLSPVNAAGAPARCAIPETPSQQSARWIERESLRGDFAHRNRGERRIRSPRRSGVASAARPASSTAHSRRATSGRYGRSCACG